MKHFKHASEIFAKTTEKHLKTIANIHNIHIKYLQRMHERMQHPDKPTCNNTSENTNETLGTDLCNIRV
jgi:hypothetical protein